MPVAISVLEPFGPPDAVVQALAELLAARGETVTAAQAVARIRAAAGLRRSEAFALIDAVVRTGLARIEASGALDLHPGTHVQDLAARVAVGERARAEGERRQAVAAWADRVMAAAQADPAALRRATADVPTAAVWLAVRATPSAEGRPGGELPAIARKVRAILHALDGALVERRPHARAVLLALIAGQHALLLGPPGTAKSLLARSLCAAFAEGAYFEYLLSRFTHPDELFGPVSIPGLKDEDYRRLTQGFLPTAHVAFLDEIFKANSAILNSLLTLINERVFHHGRHRDQVPLLGLIGASNELPDEGAGLEALYDRFLVRLSVPPISDEEAFLRVVTGVPAALDLDAAHRLTIDEVVAIRHAAQSVRVPPAVERALVALWRRATQAEWGLSDRRWRQAVGLLRVAAATEGRDALDPLDLLLLGPCLSGDPDRQGEVDEALLELLDGVSPAARAMSDPALAQVAELEVQWSLLALDRVAPTVGDPVPLGDPPTTWRDRLALRQRALDRLATHHEAAVDALAVARERAASTYGERLWLAELPDALVAPYLAAARVLGDLLDRIERYRSSIASPQALVEHGVGWLPTEDRLRPEHLDAVIQIDEIAAVGYAYRQWRRLPRIDATHATIHLTTEGWLDWLSGARTHDSLLVGLDPRQRRALQGGLLSLHDALAPQLMPAPDRVG